jgi:hypothetical protein
MISEDSPQQDEIRNILMFSCKISEGFSDFEETDMQEVFSIMLPS